MVNGSTNASYTGVGNTQVTIKLRCVSDVPTNISRTSAGHLPGAEELFLDILNIGRAPDSF